MIFLSMNAMLPSFRLIFDNMTGVTFISFFCFFQKGTFSLFIIMSKFLKAFEAEWLSLEQSKVETEYAKKLDCMYEKIKFLTWECKTCVYGIRLSLHGPCLHCAKHIKLRTVDQYRFIPSETVRKMLEKVLFLERAREAGLSICSKCSEPCMFLPENKHCCDPYVFASAN